MDVVGRKGGRCSSLERALFIQEGGNPNESRRRSKVKLSLEDEVVLCMPFLFAFGPKVQN